MSLDAKIFDLKFSGFRNIQIDDFNILGHGSRMSKKFSIGGFAVQKPSIQTFNTLKSCPWMLKVLIFIFWNSLNSKSNILRSLLMTLNPKSFDLNVFGSPNLRIGDFKIPRSCPEDLKTFDLDAFGFSNVQIRILTPWAHALDSKSFYLYVLRPPNL